MLLNELVRLKKPDMDIEWSLENIQIACYPQVIGTSVIIKNYSFFHSFFYTFNRPGEAEPSYQYHVALRVLKSSIRVIIFCYRWKFIWALFYLLLHVLMCVVCIQACVHVLMWGHVCGRTYTHVHRCVESGSWHSVSSMVTLLSIDWGRASLTVPRALGLASLGSQLALEIPCLCFLRAGIRDGCHVCLVVLGLHMGVMPAHLWHGFQGPELLFLSYMVNILTHWSSL